MQERNERGLIDHAVGEKDDFAMMIEILKNSWLRSVTYGAPTVYTCMYSDILGVKMISDSAFALDKTMAWALNTVLSSSHHSIFGCCEAETKHGEP
jgi:hypothetical protein